MIDHNSKKIFCVLCKEIFSRTRSLATAAALKKRKTKKSFLQIASLTFECTEKVAKIWEDFFALQRLLYCIVPVEIVRIGSTENASKITCTGL